MVVSLLSELLKLDWRKRINAIDALQHPYFSSPPLPAQPGELPPFEDSHELDRRKFRGQKAVLPPAPAGGSVGMGPNGEWTGGSGVRLATDQRCNRPPGLGRPSQPNNNGFSNGPPRRPYDNRIPEAHQSHKKQVSEKPHAHLPAWQRDNSSLPPKPPVSNHQPWATGQGWRADAHVDQRRERQMPRGDGRLEVHLDSYVPNYDSLGGDRPKGRGDGGAPRRDNSESREVVECVHDLSGPQSRSPDLRDRDRSRDDGKHYHPQRRR